MEVELVDMDVEVEADVLEVEVVVPADSSIVILGVTV